MRYIIRTVEHGQRIPLEAIQEKKMAAYSKFLDAGLQYIEYEATLGSLSPLGHRVEEKVFIIEPISEANYV